MDDNTTLVSAKQYFRESLREGIKCPCCDTFKKEYPRKLDARKIKALIHLYNLDKSGKSWIHIQDEFIEQYNIKNPISLEYDKLRYWGLIETKQKSADENSNSKSGLWRITPKGIMFVTGFETVQEYAIPYNKEWTLEGNLIDVWQALNNKFDYEELMGITPLHLLPGGRP